MIESDGPGGAETVVLSLARGYRDAGHEVFPVVHAGGPGWLSGQLMEAGFEVFLPSLRSAVDPFSLAQYVKWMRANRISVSHTHEFTTSVYGGTASRLLRVPYVITMHGGTSYSKAFRRRVALSAAARGARTVVGVSDATTSLLADALGMARSRLEVVPNGVASRPGDRGAGRAALSVKGNTFVIVCIGNLYEVKGHDILVEAAATLEKMDAFVDWKIFIAGRGNQEASLRNRIHSLGLQEKVHLLGLRDDIPNLLAASDLFVLPSRSEGMPIAVLEAMLSSIPVVCSSVGGLPSLLQDGELGVLVPPEEPLLLADALKLALQDRETLMRRARRAHGVVSTIYSADSMVQSYLKHLTPMSVQQRQ
jgi:glycosyltransferase involved in cell wall biosynthesis